MITGSRPLTGGQRFVGFAGDLGRPEPHDALEQHVLRSRDSGHSAGGAQVAGPAAGRVPANGTIPLAPNSNSSVRNASYWQCRRQ